MLRRVVKPKAAMAAPKRATIGAVQEVPTLVVVEVMYVGTIGSAPYSCHGRGRF